MITFPSNPSLNDTYTAAGKTWLWNGTAWQLRPRVLTSADITDFAQAVIDASPPTTNADLLTSGTLDDARLSENVLLTSQKGIANGLATLDSAGLVPSAQLPSYVDDVIESADFASLPAIGETGKIYVTLADRKTFRWSGSVYIEISASPGSTDAVPEGSLNLYFTEARAIAAAQDAIDGKQIKTVYSDTAPSHAVGLEWVDTTDLRSYRSISGLWIEIDRA
jgi:hypothetical protein